MGILICEDSWAEDESGQRKKYHINPTKTLSEENPDVFINISSSPFSTGWHNIRKELIQKTAKKYNKPFIYVNQVGSNDDIIFDGGSFAVNDQGDIVCQAKNFEEDIVYFNLEKQEGDIHNIIEDELESIYTALKLGISDYARKCGFTKAVLGLSGGIDSALTAALACDALGSENILALMMPSKFSSRSSVDDAQALAQNFKIQTDTLPINDVYDVYLKALKEPFHNLEFNAAEENIQARIRGNLIMAFSNKFGHLVLSTGNKSELAVGYCTLYGDMSGGLSVLGDVPKTLVYKLCEFRNKKEKLIPQDILTKPPSAELRPNQTDQDTLPPYDVLDPIIKAYVEDQLLLDQIINLGYDPDVVKKIVKLIDLNEYKRRQAAVTLRITSKAFGTGRRLPIAQKFTQEIL